MIKWWKSLFIKIKLNYQKKKSENKNKFSNYFSLTQKLTEKLHKTNQMMRHTINCAIKQDNLRQFFDTMLTLQRMRRLLLLLETLFIDQTTNWIRIIRNDSETGSDSRTVDQHPQVKVYRLIEPRRTSTGRSQDLVSPQVSGVNGTRLSPKLVVGSRTRSGRSCYDWALITWPTCLMMLYTHTHTHVFVCVYLAVFVCVCSG